MQKKSVFLSLTCLITLSHMSHTMNYKQHYAANHTLISIDNKIFDNQNKDITKDISKILTKFETTNIPTAELSKPSEYLLTIMHDKIKYTMDVSPTFYQTISNQKPLILLSLLELQNNPHTSLMQYRKFIIEKLADNTNK